MSQEQKCQASQLVPHRLILPPKIKEMCQQQQARLHSPAYHHP